jgi:hypothetical protein
MGIGKVGDLNTKTEIEKDIVESRTCRKKNSRPLKEHPKPKSSRSLLLCRYIDDNVWKYPSSVMCYYRSWKKDYHLWIEIWKSMWSVA